MTTGNDKEQELLCQEILADARRECDKILQDASREAGALLARTGAVDESYRKTKLEAAVNEADGRRESVFATADVEARRMESEQMENLLQSIYGRIRQRLQAREGFDYREMMFNLAAEAICNMTAGKYTMRMSAADHEILGDGWQDEIRRRAGRNTFEIVIKDDSGITGGGLIVEDYEGGEVWDNRLPARLQRMWPELRIQIAGQTGLLDLDIETGDKT
ncbi:MAG: V-type ATP synthase subunit E family protein [Victivallales bacterium]